MLRRSSFILVLCVVAIFKTTTTLARTAPQFELPVIGQSTTLKLSDLKGKVVYVDFWASWCPPCVVSIPALEDIRTQFLDQGFEVVAINLDLSEREAMHFLKSRPVSYPVLFDINKITPVLYGVEGMPTAFLIDRAGRVRSTHAGFKKSDSEKLMGLIQELLNEGVR